jgi:hypothetical protein
MMEMVGTVGFADLSQALHRVEKRLRGTVNSVLYSREEFGTTLRARDHFLTSLLDRAKRFLLGERLALATATAPSLGPDTCRPPKRTGQPPGHCRARPQDARCFWLL